MSREFFLERIAVTKALIVGYEEALQAFADNGAIQQYSINTGQNTTSVSRAQIASLRILLDGLYNRLATLEARVYGGTTQARPCW